ncbi:MAG: PAS domain S-box protein [Solirubrobacterales bacterium]|nr:PAS domain S-box protein [Solirubrobacterales bacterium]
MAAPELVRLRTRRPVIADGQDDSRIQRVGRREPAVDPTLGSTEALCRKLVESSTELIVLVDDDGRLAFVNGACEELLGYERGEMLGRELSDFVALDADAWVKLAFASPNAARVCLRRELTALRKDGARVEAALNAASVRDADTRARAIVAVIKRPGENAAPRCAAVGRRRSVGGVNDRFGHPAGDVVCARSQGDCTRSLDELMAVGRRDLRSQAQGLRPGRLGRCSGCRRRQPRCLGVNGGVDASSARIGSGRDLAFPSSSRPRPLTN